MFRCPECDFLHQTVVEKCQNCEYIIGMEETHSQSFTAISAVTAQLEREQSGNLAFKIGRLWNLKNEVSNDFILKVESKFRNKNKFHNFLTKDTLPNSIPTILNKYIKNSFKFKDLVKFILGKIKVEVGSDKRKLTGASDNNIIFIHYKVSNENDDFGRLLIVMVDKKGAFDFEKVALTPKKLSPIDTEALRQAALFDLTLFDASYPENNGESYVRFIQGKSKSDFFKDALGCRKDVDNNRSINNLFAAILDFSNQVSLPIPLRDKIEESVKDFIEKKSKDKNDKSISLQDIQNKVDKCLPEKHPALGKFSKFVNIHEYEIDEVFEPTRFSAKNATSIELSDKSKNFTCKVRKTAIGSEHSTKPIKLDKENRCLLLPLTDEDFLELEKFVRD